MPRDGSPAIELVEPGPDLRAACELLEVAPAQERFVAPVSHYLALCDEPDSPWRPLAVLHGGVVAGFVMHGIDPAEDSAWIGGLVIDRAHQRRGLGRAVVGTLVGRAAAHGRPSALSYEPENAAAKALYASEGFVESGEFIDDEVVARRAL
jgi:diamine N-acetyltransferase